ncbi:MAG: LPS-assembly protein LptD [Rhodospirillales bacterium]|nr:LPS-assembly protein LptD [Rhodospirillales bacterium]
MFLRLTCIALVTTAVTAAPFDLVQVIGHAHAAEPSVNSNRPLGILITPIPDPTQKDGVADVYAPSAAAAPRPAQAAIFNTIPEVAPPLGLLLAPLPDNNPAEAPLPLTGITDVQIRPVQIPLTTPEATNANASQDRPLGVLMDQTKFVPDPQYISGNAGTGPAGGFRTPTYDPPADLWNAQGKTGTRPLGTLLLPGSYTPAPAAKQQTSPTIENRPLQRPVSLPDQKVDTATSQEPAVNFSAEEMGFDQESGIVTAEGNVEIHYQKRSLRADKVTYNRDTNEVIAEGNVVIVEPTSETIFGDKIQISGDLKDGYILNIGIILQDRARIAGSSGTRTGGIKTDLNHAVYSPCNLCKDDPNRPPVWQIKAVKVSHDKKAKVIEYRDAWIEFFGFPVFYTPYFRHPDPTVKRRSGLLFPTFGNSSDLGTIIEQPYFWNISPNEDATITPILLTAENPVLAGEYRNRLKDGAVDVTGSVTASSNDADDFSTENGRFGTRGHILSEGRFDINRSWRWGFDGNWTTDDTYMRRYGFTSPPSLESQLFTESFKRRSYFAARAHSFQSLQAEDDADQIPVVLPLVDFNYVGDKDRFGGSTNLDFNFLALTRQDGLDTRRLSARSHWQRPFVGLLGDVYNISFGLNSDIYHVNNLARGGSEEDYDGFSYRVTPEAAFNWRLPFAKTEGNISQIIEPIASFMWSPYGGNSNKIPNEDSTELEFDDTNLFSSNRFSGLDRVEGGPRIIYGLKWGAYGVDGGKTNVFVGQSWRPKTDDTYAAGSGLEDNFSDLVARLNITPGPHLDASFRTRFSAENLAPTKQELNLNAGVPALRVSASYLFLERQVGSEFAGREELSMNTSSQIDRFWRTGINGTHDLQSKEMRTVGMHLTYEDECVTFVSRLNRTFFEDRDLEPTDSITFNLVLKTIGEVKTGGSLF